MAGIGFELEKILSKETITSFFQGYIYAAIIYCGPWLFTIICLALLGWRMPLYLGLHSAALVRVMIIYCFCFSLITTAPLSMVITRHIANLIYENHEEKISSVFMSSTVFILAVESIFVIPFLLYMDGDLGLKANGFICFLLVSFIWHLTVFISAVKDYKNIAVSFAVGMLLSFFLSDLIGRSMGVNGVLLGFNLGLLFICYTLASRILIEFYYPSEWNFSFLYDLSRYWELAVFGLFYSLGIWIDKIIFWYSKEGIVINNLLQAHHPYDSSMFLAYLTTVPALAYFFVEVETEYYRKYRQFYQSILQKRGLKEIDHNHIEMADSITTSFINMAQIQMVISLTAIFLAPKVIDMFGLDWTQLHIARIGVLAALLQAFILLTSIIIFYFDFRKDAMFIALTLFVSNTYFTTWSLDLGFRFHGYGYFISTLITLILALALLKHRVKHLTFFTFCRETL